MNAMYLTFFYLDTTNRGKFSVSCVHHTKHFFMSSIRHRKKRIKFSQTVIFSNEFDNLTMN